MLNKDSFVVSSKPFKKKVSIPTSKSYANRILILASLCESRVTIKNLPQSTDVLHLISCLKKVGIIFKEEGELLHVINSFPSCETNDDNFVVLETGDGGTTNRFLLPFLGRGKKRYILRPTGKMKTRPMEELIEGLRILDVDIEQGGEEEDYSLKIQGPMSTKVDGLSVDCSRSTQFASGMAMVLWDRSLKIELENFNSSKSYYEMTVHLCEQLKKGKTFFEVPPDFSSLSYPFVLGATLGEVFVEECYSKDKFQSDSCLLDIFEQMGGELVWKDSGLFIKSPSKLSPLQWDCSNCPDLVPTLAYLCSYAEGMSCLGQIKVLRHKESDRISELEKIFGLFGVNYSYNEASDELFIYGRGLGPTNIGFKKHIPAEDHRMIMVTYLFMRKNQGGEVYNASHVKKSFPNFFDELDS